MQEYIRKSVHIEETELSDEKQEKLITGSTLHAKATELDRKAQMEEFMFLGFRMTLRKKQVLPVIWADRRFHISFRP